MGSSTLIIAEMVLTLGLCLGFGFYQLWDLRREKAKDAAKAAETAAAKTAADTDTERAGASSSRA